MRRFLLFLFAVTLHTLLAASVLSDFLNAIPGAEVRELQSTVYSEYYIVMLPQPLDHMHPDNGETFKQRIFIGHRDFSASVVMETDGYSGTRAGDPDFQDEPEKLFMANQIFVEHRYFGKSMPDSMDYRYLTIEQATADYHAIRTLFAGLYKGKWIATGISKGGQTAASWKMYYPQDMDACICYVAPMLYGQEDQRIYDHFKTVGTAKCREKIFDFQESLEENKKTLMPAFMKRCINDGYVFTTFSAEEVFDYMVLEYPFSFWQWHGDCSMIPKANAKDDKKLDGLFAVIPPDYYTKKGLESFYPAMYMFYTELGYYEYDETPFRKYLTDYDYLNSALCPPGITVHFDTTYIHHLKAFIAGVPEKMIFVYGALDPWGAAGLHMPPNTDSLAARVYYVAGGTHASRIVNLSSAQQHDIYNALQSWLSVEIYPIPKPEKKK